MTELISTIHYPDLERIMNMKPNPHILLGKEIVWTEKRDGSNLGVYLSCEETGPLVRCRSRNMDVASEEFHNYFKSTDVFENVAELLMDASNWGDEYLLFGELLIKGKSPTKIELHDKTEFVAFDLWSRKTNGFVNYTKLYQECYHHNIPVVEVWGTCNVVTIEELLSFRDEMLNVAKDLGNREGVVGKYVSGEEFLYFKEKNDTPKYEKVPRAESDGKIILPPLPDSELTGAIEKVYTDLGKDFFDIRRAMPKIAEYVAIECKKHNCAGPEKKLIVAYHERIEELK